MENVREDAACGEIGRVISLKEAAGLLSVSVSTVYRMVSSGELEAFRVRNTLRTSTAICEDYIRRQQRHQAVLCRIRKG